MKCGKHTLSSYAQPHDAARRVKQPTAPSAALCRATSRCCLPHRSQALGWLHRHKAVPLDQLSLRRLVPGSEKAAARTAHDFAMWQVQGWGQG